jgi:hypothetical protein
MCISVIERLWRSISTVALSSIVSLRPRPSLWSRSGPGRSLPLPSGGADYVLHICDTTKQCRPSKHLGELGRAPFAPSASFSVPARIPQSQGVSDNASSAWGRWVGFGYESANYNCSIFQRRRGRAYRPASVRIYYFVSKHGPESARIAESL